MGKKSPHLEPGCVEWNGMEPPPPDFRGLVRVPRTEADVAVLASLMLQDLGACVHRAGDQYPDWNMFVPCHDRGMVEVNVELEPRSSNFASHMKTWRRAPESCQMILCWEQDSDHTRGQIPILDLKSYFYRLPLSRQRQLCWEASFRGPDGSGLRAPVRFEEIPPVPSPIATRRPELGFHGLMHAPTTEAETIVLMGRLLVHADFCIEAADTSFPDWSILVHKGGRWVRQLAEVECWLSEFRTHQKELKANPQACQRVIAWGRDVDSIREMPADILIVKDVLDTRKDANSLCLGLQAPAVTDPGKMKSFLLEQAPQPVGSVFWQIIDGLRRIGFGFIYDSDQRCGVSFRFLPKELRSCNTENLNLFCFGRGRYLRPTVWWSLASLKNTGFDQGPIDAFSQRLREISGAEQHVTYGVHRGPEDFHLVLEPILELAGHVRKWLNSKGLAHYSGV